MISISNKNLNCYKVFQVCALTSVCSLFQAGLCNYKLGFVHLSFHYFRQAFVTVSQGLEVWDVKIICNN